MQSSLPQIIQYFHDCYRSDNRELAIFDFLDTKIENKVFIKGKEELITGEYPKTSISSKSAEILLKKLEVFQKEKELLYGSFFVCGHFVDFKGEVQRLCSPLFYYPAQIQSKDDYHYLSIRPGERTLNLPLISLLSKESNTDLLEDPAFDDFPKDFIGFDNMAQLIDLFGKHFPKVDTEPIYAFPENASGKSLRSMISKLEIEDRSKLVLIPTSILGLATKSTNTRGVLNELMELSKQKSFSVPLNTLFNQSGNVSNTKKEYKKGKIPMILSEAQQALLKSSSTNPVTVIVGPPGTGKTYTIGAIALEHMSRGETVLISSRSDEAVDVIANKLRETLGTGKCVVRGGKRRIYSAPLNQYLKALLTRVKKRSYMVKEFDLTNNKDGSSILKRIDLLVSSTNLRLKSIVGLEHDFEKNVGSELKWGKHLTKQNHGLWDKVKTKFLAFRSKVQTSLWELSADLFNKDQKQIEELLELLKLQYVTEVLTILRTHWQVLHEFGQAIKLSSDTERLLRFEYFDFSIILKAFPIWLTNLSDIKNVLPFNKKMFDVVIIDEATQCDIASCLPLIQRGKRVVIAGDPNQLRHISFLSNGMQSIHRNKHELNHIEKSKLNYRDHSILDLAMDALKSGDQVAMLDEHFRSIRPLISFSNQKFYDGALRIMTTRPDEEEQGVYFYYCNGKREKNGSNVSEAQTLIDDVRKVIDSEVNLTSPLATSLGIISPFRDQVNLLSKMLFDAFSFEEIDKHQIRVGTAYSFQGEEREQMFLSFTVDKNSHHSALHHINKEDVFNVAITRARSKQHVYLSLEANDLKPGSLLRSYITSCQNQNQAIESSNEYQDRFLDEVTTQLKDWGIENFWLGFSIAGLEIDLLLKYQQQYFGIDLIGYPGEFENSFGIERFRILNRAGIKVFPLPYSDWRFEKDKTCDVLKSFIGV